MNAVHYHIDIMNAVHYIPYMPKLIPELKDKILTEAEGLFLREGFDGVSMRQLAAGLDIAVGTLYNYFPNKMRIFESIMQKSWDSTFHLLSKLTERAEAATSETRRAAIEIIYEGIRSRGALALKTFEPSILKANTHSLDSNHNNRQEELAERLCSSLAPFGAGFAGPEAERLSVMLLSTIRFLIFNSESDARDADIDFLLNIIEGGR